MKILHTNFHRGWGGQSNRILVECRKLTERGHEITLAVPDGSELAKRAAAAGLRVFPHVRFARGFRPVPLAADFRALRGLLRRENFDIIHTHGSQDSWAMAFTLLGFQPRPLVLKTRHNIFPMRDHWPNRLLYGKWTDGMVCISNAILEDCAAKPYLKRERLGLIHSAVDVEAFAGGDGPAIRQEFGLNGRWVLGVTGRLRPEKGHWYLLEALPEIARQAPDVLLLIVGAGSLEGGLKARAAQLGMEKHVVFTGFRSDVRDILAALDVYVLPSLSEGLGTAIIEAGAAGCPIVTSRVGGIPDIVTDGETGLMTPPANPGELAQALLRFYRDRGLAARCGRAAAEHARTCFSEEFLGLKTEEFYLKALGWKTPGG